MKRKFKRITSLVLAMVMVFAMAMPAMAADELPTNSKIVIDNGAEHHTYKAYQILSGNPDKDDPGISTPGSAKLGDPEWGSGVTKEGQNALMALLKADNFEDFIEKLSDGDAETAKLIADTMKKDGNLGDPSGTATAPQEGKYTISGLKPGYYLVTDELTEGAAADAEISAYLVYLVRAEITVEPKTGTPSFEKKVKDTNDSTGESSDWQDSADYDIHDKVPYQLTVTLPDNYNDYIKFYLSISDDLSEGLTNNKDFVVKVVKKDGTEVTEVPGTFTLTEYIKYKTEPDDVDDFTITIDDLRKVWPNLAAGDKLVFTYSATLNENAKLGGEEGNLNTAQLTYSRDPNWNGEGTPDNPGKTPEDKVVVFTFDTTIDKIDSTGNPLAGAEFTLYKWMKDGTAAGDEETGEFPAPDGNAGYWKALEATTVTDNTEFDFQGLDDGIYKLVETVVPAGYNKADDIDFTIVATHSADGGNPVLETFGVTFPEGSKSNLVAGTESSGSTATTTKPGDADKTVKFGSVWGEVVNKEGALLPETGGIGTTIFYVVGSVLVLGAVILLVTKRRMKG